MLKWEYYCVQLFKKNYNTKEYKMKRLLFAVLMLTLISSTFTLAIDGKKGDKTEAKVTGAEKELFIVLTTGDKEVLTKVVAPYLSVSAKSWEKRTLLIWGPSEKTIAENAELADVIKKLKDGGVILKACKWCADQYKVGDKLAALGFEVAYMGTPLTEALQSNLKMLTF
jgi:hypothetical protein